MTKFWLYWGGLEEEQLMGLLLFQLISTWEAAWAGENWKYITNLSALRLIWTHQSWYKKNPLTSVAFGAVDACSANYKKKKKEKISLLAAMH